ncbi:MAG: rod shape determining protein RodA [Eubacteriales bacterium]|nr:rod shape determining protein RodA [Eubacteriales bacterium]
MFERRHLKNLDFPLIIVTILLLLFGLVAIASATHFTAGEKSNAPYYLTRQVVGIFLGLVAILFILRIDYNDLAKISWGLYGINLGLLALVDILGHTTLGAQRWIKIGPLQLQPSELAKVLIIITFADFLQKRAGRLNSLRQMLPCFIYIAIPALLIMKQPDLGTTLVFIAIMFGMMYTAGARPAILLSIFLGGLALAIGVVYGQYHFGWKWPLEEYQLKRLTAFLNPTRDPLGSGYQVIQSLVAIGSGGVFGKGLFKGTQIGLDFLPRDEQHTDFIFAVLGEELGLVGELVLLFLFFLFLYRCLVIAARAKDLYGTLLAAGVVSMVSFHLLVNIGMTTGIMPVTGIPLPFISYGGSSILANLAAVGLLLNVNMRRRKITF